MKMWQRGLVVTMALAGLGGGVTPGAVVFADEAGSATSSSAASIQADTDLTLAGDAIAVQKLKVGCNDGCRHDIGEDLLHEDGCRVATIWSIHGLWWLHGNVKRIAKD